MNCNVKRKIHNGIAFDVRLSEPCTAHAYMFECSSKNHSFLYFEQIIFHLMN